MISVINNRFCDTLLACAMIFYQMVECRIKFKPLLQKLLGRGKDKLPETFSSACLENFLSGKLNLIWIENHFEVNREYIYELFGFTVLRYILKKFHTFIPILSCWRKVLVSASAIFNNPAMYANRLRNVYRVFSCSFFPGSALCWEWCCSRV